MLSNAFKIRVSSNAERLDFESLPEQERKVLCSGIKYNPSTHDCYRFFVAAEVDPDEENNKLLRWFSKRRTFDKTDRVLVQSRPSKKAKIYFYGIFPTTATADGQWGLDLESEAIFKSQMPGIGGLKVVGQLKHKIRKDKFTIYASRTDALAQWVFLEPWIKAGGEFRLQILCSVDKLLPQSDRRLLCDVEFSDNGRRLAALYNKKVLLP